MRRRPPGELLSDRAVELAYEHVDEPDPDQPVRVHDFDPGVEVWALRSGDVLLRRPDGRPLQKRQGGRLWLVNPPRAGAKRSPNPKGQTMARTPARDPKTGRFLTKRQQAARAAARKRTRKKNAPAKAKAAPKRKRAASTSTPSRSKNPVARRNMPARRADGRFKKGGRSTRSRSTSRSRPRRRNPPKKDLVGRFASGLMDATTVSLAQGITRLVPGVLNLPRSGPTGLAVSLATGVVVGMASEQFMGSRAAELVTAAALSVPLQTAAVQYIAPAVPLVGTMFVPTLGSYSRPALRRTANGARMASYSAPSRMLPSQSMASGFPYGGVAGYDYASGVW